MSRIKALKGKTDNIIVGDFTIKVKSLSFPKLLEFSELSEQNQKVDKELIQSVVFDCLRDSLPTRKEDKENGFNDEEVQIELDAIDSAIALKVFKRVLELSGLGEEKEKKS